MGADFSRVRFDPLLDYAGVELQQGRVLLDADANELVGIVDRRLRALASDVLGRATVSSTTPDAFKISVAGGTLQIARGRLYVDGLLAENHGAASAEPAKRVFDDLLAETRFVDPVAYTAQPYLPNPPALPDAGRHLVYLDVWDREVTYLERPDLIESAVGVDATSRVQTVWQVRVLADDAGAGTSCASPDADVPGWSALIAPSTGMLTTGTFDIAAVDDPCELPPTGGYRGLENQLYRVEIHDPGQAGAGATFKWSRENASVGSRVASIVSGTELELQTLGRDDVLRFNTGDWVEITDDVRELSQASGEMRRITLSEATRRIQFTPALPADMLPGSFPDSVFPRDRHLRVCRWDQSGLVFRTDAGGTPVQVQDLDAAGSTGVIAVPAEGTTLLLENGVTVSFASTGSKGFRAGDYWVFAARTADASVEILDRAPPYGIHHHFTRLAFYTPPDQVEDCRDQPEHEEGECCCTIVVQPGEDVQAAIDSLPPEGGCVCLKAGLHVVGATVVIARSDVSLHGESQGAVLRLPGDDPVLAIRGSSFAEPAERVRVHGIRFEGGEISTLAGGIVTVDDALDLRIEDCDLRAVGQEQESASVGLRIAASRQVAVTGCGIAGVQIGLWATVRSAEVSITDCRIDLGAGGERSGGIAGIFVDNADGPFLVADSEIAGGLFGVVIDDAPVGAPSSLARASIVRANRVICVQPEGVEPDAESALVGIDVAGEDCLIEGNEVRYPGPGNVGIRISGSGVRVLDNRCVATNPEAGRAPALGLMIGVDPERADRLIANVEARGNTISGAQGGILVVQASDVAVVANDLQIGSAQAAIFGVLAQDSRAVDILDNRIRGGFAAIGATSTGNLRVEGNTATGGTLGILVSVGERPSIVRNRVEGAGIWGIVLTQIMARAEVAANRVIGCGFGSAPGIGIGAAEVLGELNLESNEVMNTGNGPDEQRSETAIGLFGHLILEARVAGNLVTYSGDEARDPGNEDRALLMHGYLEQTFGFGAGTITIGFPIQILGNKFIGTGFTALVELRETRISDNIVRRFERVTFNDNYCAHFSPPQISDARATVSLEGRRGIVMGNHVKATTPDYFSVNFNLMPSTYVGNVVEGPAIRGTPIPTPDSDYNLSS